MQFVTPVIKFGEWKETALTLHLVSQMLGKTKLAFMEPQPEWMHIVLPLTPQGFTTGLLPNGGKSFSISLNLLDGSVWATRADGRASGFHFAPLGSVADYYAEFSRVLADIDCEAAIFTMPQEMSLKKPFEDCGEKLAYDPAKAQAFHKMCLFAHNAIMNFMSPFRGKKLLPALFWGTFDTTGVLFGGKPQPWPGKGVIEVNAFDEQLMEFGFWPGDENVDDPAFFILPYPFFGKETKTEGIKPDAAWYSLEKSEFFLKLSDALSTPDPEATVHSFFQSGFEIICKAAGWANLEWLTSPLLTQKGSEALRHK